MREHHTGQVLRPEDEAAFIADAGWMLQKCALNGRTYRTAELVRCHLAAQERLGCVAPLFWSRIAAFRTVPVDGRTLQELVRVLAAHAARGGAAGAAAAATRRLQRRVLEHAQELAPGMTAEVRAAGPVVWPVVWPSMTWLPALALHARELTPGMRADVRAAGRA